MKTRWFHFLGGVHFAIILIVSAALFVLWGTLLESHTSSHRFAARYTYQNPAFLLLLGLFFINILLAALRRWPFRRAHLPFLITHLGLLMVIAGAFVKATVGLQGVMRLLEGTATHTVHFPETYAVRVEGRDGREGIFDPRQGVSPFAELKIELIDYQLHSHSLFESWIKGSKLSISGLPLLSITGGEQPLAWAQILPPPSPPCRLIACDAENTEEAARRIYLGSIEMRLREAKSGQLLYEGPYSEQIEWAADGAQLEFQLNPPQLIVEGTHYAAALPLSGPKALIPQDLRTSHLGSSPWTIDLSCPSTLLFLRDREGRIAMYLFDSHGRIGFEQFMNDRLDTLIAYDSGYRGYAVQAKLPFWKEDREGMMQRFYDQIQRELHQVELQALPLPLQLLSRACQAAGADFAAVCLHWLQLFDKHHSWLFPDQTELPQELASVFALMDWSQVPATHRKACYALSAIFRRLEARLQLGDSVHRMVEELGWPLPLPQEGENFEVLMALTHQLFAAADEMEEHGPDLVEPPARLLSAYFRAYQWHLTTFPFELPLPETLFLETSLRSAWQARPASTQLEENLPSLTLKLSVGSKTDFISLSYDPSATALKWGALDGQYRLRFQPSFKEIPYTLRLRSARTISYPHSNQPYSYEANLLISDRRTGQESEVALTMNRVYETTDGYRFYLSHVSPSKGALQQIQLAVNRDPVRYWLTYPGGVLIAMGIVGLFSRLWTHRSRTRD